MDEFELLELYQDCRCIVGLDPEEEMLLILITEFGERQGWALFQLALHAHENRLQVLERHRNG